MARIGTMNNYYDKCLRSQYWDSIRLLVFERDGHKCVLCNSSINLESHHRTYDRLGHELPEDLTTLCHDCHGEVTNFLRQRRYEIKLNWENPDTARTKQPERKIKEDGTKEFEVQDTRRCSPYST